MKVTLKDIAEDTDFSISTVSMVLNGSKKISAKTRKEVYRSAKKLKYPLRKPINGDKHLDTLNVALVFARFDSGEFYASFINGYNTAAQDQNIQLSIIVLNTSFKETLKRLEKLPDIGIDGIILFAPQYSRKDYQRIKNVLPDKFPVASNGLIENPVFSSVTFDGYSGGFSTARHFQEKGYKKVGIIRGAFKAIEARYRANGFKDYVSQADDMKLMWDFDGDFSFDSGREAFSAFHKLEEKPEAVFASNDTMCFAFVGEALNHGYDIPGDVAIIGYDDLLSCKRHRPGISSVNTNYQKLGNVTMEKLKEMLSNPKQEQGVLSLIPVTLQERESS